MYENPHHTVTKSLGKPMGNPPFFGGLDTQADTEQLRGQLRHGFGQMLREIRHKSLVVGPTFRARTTQNK